MKLYVFNPDTEMALANNNKYYTAPSSIRRFINNLCLLPALYADNKHKFSLSDNALSSPTVKDIAILLPSGISDDLCKLPYYDLIYQKQISIIPYNKLSDISSQITEACPWGWNASVKHHLLSAGINSVILPTDSGITELRILAHRSTTIDILGYLTEYFCNDPLVKHLSNLPPICFTDPTEALQYIDIKQKCVIKQPWSSSGRGVFFVTKGVDKSVEQIVAGTISHQKSIIVENMWEKSFDFATEWYIHDGEVSFEGLSAFRTDTHGNYAGNIINTQAYIEYIISKYCSTNTLHVAIDTIGKALEHVIGKRYSGPLGVDMLCDIYGNINPCVEINLRNTMGHVALSLWEQYKQPSVFYPGRPYPEKF